MNDECPQPFDSEAEADLTVTIYETARASFLFGLACGFIGGMAAGIVIVEKFL